MSLKIGTDPTSLQAQSGNATAITLLSQAPSTIVRPVYFTLNNVRPYNQPVATAITLVGAIYLLIFSFIVTMTLFPVREIMYVHFLLPFPLPLPLLLPPLLLLQIHLCLTLFLTCASTRQSQLLLIFTVTQRPSYIER